MVKSVGIIGHGKMGKILKKIFKQKFPVCIYDIKTNNQNMLKKICDQDLIILCVSIDSLETILMEIKIFLKKDSIVMDICSVKNRPVKLMVNILPSNVQILGSHPTFGPNSFNSAKSIVLCPVRISSESLEQIKKVFNKNKITSIILSPQKHDLIMSNTQFITHLFALLAGDMLNQSYNFAPLSFRLMSQALKMADTNEEFLKLIYTQEAKKSLQKITNRLDKIRVQLQTN